MNAMKACTVTSTSARLPWQAGMAAIALAVPLALIGSWLSSTLSPAALLWTKSLLLAPAIEELFFRGYLHSALRSRRDAWGRPGAAIVVTAVCFGLAHLAFAPLAHSALVVLPALAIGWVYERTRSIFLCIAIHGAANAVWLTFWS